MEELDDIIAIYFALHPQFTAQEVERQSIGISDLLGLVTVLVPLLGNKSKIRPIKQARKELRGLRRDLKKGRIDQEEYDALRKKVLESLA